MAKPEAVDKLPPGSSPPIPSEWSHSLGQLLKTEFEWTIHHYTLRGPDETKSSEFSCVGCDGKKIFGIWCLSLTDNGILLYDNLKLHGETIPTQTARVTTYFLNSKREIVLSQEIILRKGTVMPALVNETTREIILQNSDDLIFNDKIVIYCLVEVFKNDGNLICQPANSKNQPLSNEDELVKYMEEFLKNKAFSDVTFHVHGQEFLAHKLILAARSPVFAAMFLHPSKEQLTGLVDVTDIEPAVFKVLLHYIYTGQVPLEQMDLFAAGLLAAANKYLMENLKKACGVHLVQKMSPENCVKLLSLGENDPAYHLKAIALEYFWQFPAQVTATNEWKKANEGKPAWFLETKEKLFDLMILKMKDSK